MDKSDQGSLDRIRKAALGDQDRNALNCHCGRLLQVVVAAEDSADPRSAVTVRSHCPECANRPHREITETSSKNHLTGE